MRSDHKKTLRDIINDEIMDKDTDNTFYQPEVAKNPPIQQEDYKEELKHSAQINSEFVKIARKQNGTKIN